MIVNNKRAEIQDGAVLSDMQQADFAALLSLIPHCYYRAICVK
jgi:hypothetical protein